MVNVVTSTKKGQRPPMMYAGVDYFSQMHVIVHV